MVLASVSDCERYECFGSFPRLVVGTDAEAKADADVDADVDADADAGIGFVTALATGRGTVVVGSLIRVDPCIRGRSRGIVDGNVRTEARCASPDELGHHWLCEAA